MIIAVNVYKFAVSKELWKPKEHIPAKVSCSTNSLWYCFYSYIFSISIVYLYFYICVLYIIFMYVYFYLYIF